MKILIVLRNIGPYHNARFESLLNANVKHLYLKLDHYPKEYLWISNEKYKYDVYKFPNYYNSEVDISNKDIDSFLQKYINLINPRCNNIYWMG